MNLKINLRKVETRLIAALLLIILLLVSSCFAKEINFDITVDRNKVPLGQALQLNLTFNGTQDMPATELPQIDGFQSRYLGPSTMMSIVNGRVSSSITHVYTLLPLKAGTFKIGPFKFEHNGDSYTSNTINVEVVEGLSRGNGEPESRGIPQEQNINDRLFLILQPKKNKTYLNEVVPLTIKLYVNRLAVRDIQYPQVNHEGFSLGEFERPKQYQEVLGGINYDVIEFDTYFFGMKQGECKLGPANLKCNLIIKKENRRTPSGFEDFFDSNVFEDFFGRYETYPFSLKSADIPITVSALPEDNKPQDFSGAVGDFDLEVTVGPAELKVGDPITVKATVKGEGNFSTVTMPKINPDKNFKIYEPQVKEAQGQKIFEQIFIPLNDSVTEIPAMRFNFFNTNTGKYQIITKGPFPVKVNKPDKEEQQKIIELNPARGATLKEETLGRDIIYIKDSLGELKARGDYLYKNKLFLWLQIIPLLGYLSVFAFNKRKQRLHTDVRYARLLHAPRKAKAGIRRAKSCLESSQRREFYDALFETLQEYLGNKFHLPSGSITISIVDDILKYKNIDEDILNTLKYIFKECDEARFAASESLSENGEDLIKKLEEVIDYLQRKKV